MYTITDIIEFKSDNNGQLHCIFKIDGDEPNLVRFICDDDYYDWVERTDGNKDYYIGPLDDDDDFNDFNPVFDFDSWKEENETDEYIIDYIYENYSLDDLPEPEKLKK